MQCRDFDLFRDFRVFASFRPMAKCLRTPFRGPISFFRMNDFFRKSY